MPAHRSNKGPRTKASHLYEPWFWPHVRRQRRRDEIASASRRRNRK